jgi:hypothetical protein
MFMGRGGYHTVARALLPCQLQIGMWAHHPNTASYHALAIVMRGTLARNMHSTFCAGFTAL